MDIFAEFWSNRKFFKILTVFLSLLMVISSCQKDDGLDEDLTNENNRYVNTWILEKMQGLYLWNKEIPENADQNKDPEDYFDDLLSDQDRFSWIQPDYKELLNSLQGINREAGFEFVLYKDGATKNNVIAQIVYVKPSSPAEAAGLKRGDVIIRINDQVLTEANYLSLINQLKQNHTLLYRPIIVGQNDFEPSKSVSLTVTEYVENPNYLFKIIPAGEHKIGYYVYNFFASGTDTEENKYLDEMDNIFSIFKSEGITDLVLDLRYNSGGSETSAKNLASLIGSGIDETKLFFSKTYNDELMQEIQNDPSGGDGVLKSFFANKASNVGGQLVLNRVYILTSSRTASASELVINGLEPYMDVYLIGDITYGKNVGSFSVYEESDPKNTYGLQPIVVKVANSEGFSDYGNGIVPDVRNFDNSLYLLPLGDTQENLLASAIEHITGVPSPGRAESSNVDRTILLHSLDQKRRSFNLIVEKPF